MSSTSAVQKDGYSVAQRGDLKITLKTKVTGNWATIGMQSYRDGNKIAFVRERYGKPNSCVMSAIGSGLTRPV